MTNPPLRHKSPASPRRNLLRSSSSAGGGITLLDVVGLAHVVFGAIGLISGGMALLFAGAFSAHALWEPVFQLLVAALMILAGLWLRDGERRGAWLAAGLDAVRLVLFLSASGGVDLIALALLLGVVWLLPTLRQPSAK